MKSRVSSYSYDSRKMAGAQSLCVFLSFTKLSPPGSKVLILFFGLPVHNFLNGESVERRSGKTVCVSLLYSSSPCYVRLWSICGRVTCANLNVYLR
jgi:hypothetical protein